MQGPLNPDFWDARFGEEAYAYGKAPNAFFKSQLDKLTPGSILLPAEGEGRNAVYAAQKGWEVHALDFSEAGKQKAENLAREKGIHIHYEITDITRFQTSNRYDAIGLVFAHLPPEIRTETYQQYCSFLKPGGKVILEMFGKEQLGLPSGGPKNREWLFSKAELESIFRELDIQLLEEGETYLEEGPFHTGKAYTVRMVASV